MNTIWHQVPAAACAALFVLSTGCGDSSDDFESNSDFGGAGTSDEAGTTDEAGEAGTTEAGTTMDTDSEASTDGETSTDTDAEADADAETDTQAEGETGNAGCPDYETAEDCQADAACQSVTGSKLKENGADSPCLQESEFLGCIELQGCGDALTWFCKGNGAFLVFDTCGPEGYEMCEGPAERVGACP